MDFTLTEDQLALQETARRFAQQELTDLADEIEEFAKENSLRKLASDGS